MSAEDDAQSLAPIVDDEQVGASNETANLLERMRALATQTVRDVSERIEQRKQKEASGKAKKTFLTSLSGFFAAASSSPAAEQPDYAGPSPLRPLASPLRRESFMLLDAHNFDLEHAAVVFDDDDDDDDVRPFARPAHKQSSSSSASSSQAVSVDELKDQAAEAQEIDHYDRIIDALHQLRTEPVCPRRVFSALNLPDIPAAYRATAWRYLLGVYPVASSRAEQQVHRQRRLYRKLIRHHYLNVVVESAACERRGSPPASVAMLHQVHVDVPRTSTKGFNRLFEQQPVQAAVERLLVVWSLEHPDSGGYFQGLNDLVAPFLVAFYAEQLALRPLQLNRLSEELLTVGVPVHVEADMYWCFSRLAGELGDNYPERCAGPLMQRLMYLVRVVNEPLFRHLVDLDVDFMHFAFRWLLCCMVREFSLLQVLRMWDVAFATPNLPPFPVWNCYLAAAYLDRFSAQIMACTTFEAVVMFLQCPPSLTWTSPDVDQLIASAMKLIDVEADLARLVVLIVALCAVCLIAMEKSPSSS